MNPININNGRRYLTEDETAEILEATRLAVVTHTRNLIQALTEAGMKPPDDSKEIIAFATTCYTRMNQEVTAMISARTPANKTDRL